MWFFVAPNGFRDIRLQGVDQADKTDNDEFGIEFVDKLVEVFRIGVNFLRKEFMSNAPRSCARARVCARAFVFALFSRSLC